MIVIRVVTLDEFDKKHLERFAKTLYTAFGVGAEHSAELKVPPSTPEPFEPPRLFQDVPRISPLFADDKVLYLTSRKLKDRVLTSGTVPTQGWAEHGKARAVISTHGLKDFEAAHKLISRYALHYLGHTWDLHHCLDPRCSMYPTWTPSFQVGDAIFCPFCREKSEQKIRLASS